MSLTIPAIPTEYNGVRYRSRLEAQWAVFLKRVSERFTELSRSGVRHTIVYEPFSNCKLEYSNVVDLGHLPGYSAEEMYGVREYNPDFLWLEEWEKQGNKCCRGHFFEVKPSPVSEDYLKKLRGVAFYLATLDCPLHLCVGSFRDEEWPKVSRFPYRYVDDCLEEVFAGNHEAVAEACVEARNKRWDLA